MAPALRDRKRELRRTVLTARNALAPDLHQAASRTITARMLAQREYGNATVILAYLSFGSEFDTAEMIAAVLGSGKVLVLPRVDRDRRMLRLHRVDDLSNSTQAGVWGIREPDPQHCPEFAPESIDLVVVPGVAFTPKCARLGYGGGFYDRLIPTLRPQVSLVAAAFALQVIDDIPTTPRDCYVDRVVTELKCYGRSQPEQPK
jgi:5-formyltetrahydrofolate cyclo-ligase